MRFLRTGGLPTLQGNNEQYGEINIDNQVEGNKGDHSKDANANVAKTIPNPCDTAGSWLVIAN